MTDVKTVQLDSQYGPSIPFWPEGVTRLSVVLVFEGPEDDACVAVHGLDRDLHRIVFWAQIRSSQQDAFIQAVRDRRTGTEVNCASTSAIGKKRPRVRNENTQRGRALLRDGLDGDDGADGDVVVISTGGGGGDGPGPKSLVVHLAAPSVGGAGAKAITGLSRRETASPAARKRARPSRRR
jgi:hypothetical protein